VALVKPGESAASYKARILSYQAGEDYLALQAEACATLATLVEGLTTEQLARRPAPDKWSIQELVAHLAEDELVGAYRLRMVLSSPGTPLQAFDQDVWARTGRYGKRDVRSSLELFRVLRRANLELLRSLTTEEWDMYGVHAERGVESVRDMAMYFAGHDINHFKQIEAIRQTLAPATQGAVSVLKIVGKLAATLVLGVLLVFSVIVIIQAATSAHWTLGILATICYSGAVYLGISELRSDAARRYPIEKTVAILLLAAFTTIAVAASASLQLLRAGWAAYDPHFSVDHGYSPLLGYYLWVLLDMLPGLKVPELLAFKIPLTPTNAAAGVPVIAFRVVVLFGLLGTLKVWWHQRTAG
jgi:hypothetical protein